MILKHRIFAFMLLLMMVFNICRYQIPQVEYALFKGYIAKNLCVKKDIKGNCCQGKCFMRKQMTMANENSTENTTNTNNKKTQIIEVIEFVGASIAVLIPIEQTQRLYSCSESAEISRFASDVFVPPKHIFRL
jgi:hypothetical protein